MKALILLAVGSLTPLAFYHLPQPTGLTITKAGTVLQSSLCDPGDWPVVPASSPAEIATTASIVPGNIKVLDDERFSNADATLQIDCLPAEIFSAAEFTNPGIEVVIETADVEFSPITQGEKENQTVYEVCDGGTWQGMPTSGSATYPRARISKTVTQQLASGGSGLNGLTFRLGLEYQGDMEITDPIEVRVIAFASEVTASARSTDWTVDGLSSTQPANGRLEETP